jgi:septal ring factor EnvC (AmiA/AmiB activator)
MQSSSPLEEGDATLDTVVRIVTVCFFMLEIRNALVLQMEVKAKEAATQEARRWLDQAQGQLQNTQTALTDREIECRTLVAKLEATEEDLNTLQASH